MSDNNNKNILLEMRNIGKEFSGVKALSGINLTVSTGECIGLCGENGAGKSTLMKVLSAVYPYGDWSGQIFWQGSELKAKTIRETEDAGIVIIHQELMLAPHLSVAENIFLGNEISKNGLLDHHAMHQRAKELMQDLGMGHLNVAEAVSNFGGGHQQLIEIAKALNKKAKVLILDEPSSSLSGAEIAVLLNIILDLKKKGVACIMISHKLDEIAAVCDTIAILRDGAHVGNYPMGQLTIAEIITHMVGREINNLFSREPHDIGEVIFEAKNVTCFDPINPNRKRTNNVSFELHRGEILGVAGLVGAGRSEMAMAIFGAYQGKCTAEVWLEGKKLHIKNPIDAVNAGICMVPEDRKKHGIVPLMGVGFNMTLSVPKQYSRAGILDEATELQIINKMIDELRVKTSSPLLPIKNLSGGNQQKAVLGKMLLPNPRVLILDEPTRGVDVGAKFEIYKLIFALSKKGVSVIVISSELTEVLGLSDRVLVLGEGHLRGEFKNENLSQEMILTAALGNTEKASINAPNTATQH